jgi:indole-3-glycerol phosphate synthase
LPILCKEFIVDEAQLDAARAHGADAVLLIVRCLEPAALARLSRGAAERGLVVLTEVYDPEEVPVALDAGATLIGSTPVTWTRWSSTARAPNAFLRSCRHT